MLLPIFNKMYQTSEAAILNTISYNSKNNITERYGININNLKEENNQVESGMFLSTLFSKYNISGSIISDIIEKTEEIFDVRSIKSGNKYSVFYKNDNKKDIKYIIYEKNLVDYIVFDFADSLKVYAGKKQVTVETKTAAGEIESSLWVAMENAGVSPLMANSLSDIYAWSVNFFALQKGDKFKFIYEERFVDGKSIGFGKIHTAYFEHNSKKLYAIPFKQDSTENYYNADGSSLKKAFLKAPLSYSRIASGFTMSRFHPILHIYRAHPAVDYCAPSGTPVVALGDGVVILAAFSGGAGNYIKIQHNSIYTTGYMHLKGYAAGIKQGSHVSQGQLIGYVGSTGLSTGPHLDFRVWKNGVNVDPLNLDAPPVEPISEKNIAEFSIIRDKYKSELDAIQYNTPNSSDLAQLEKIISKPNMNKTFNSISISYFTNRMF